MDGPTAVGAQSSRQASSAKKPASRATTTPKSSSTPSISALQSMYAHQPARTRSLVTSSSSSKTVEVKCQCGVPARERTVVKEGPNTGRRFWKCGNGDDCDFFEWIDGPSNLNGNQTGGTSAGQVLAPRPVSVQ